MSHIPQTVWGLARYNVHWTANFFLPQKIWENFGGQRSTIIKTYKSHKNGRQSKNVLQNVVSIWILATASLKKHKHDVGSDTLQSCGTNLFKNYILKSVDTGKSLHI